MAFDSLAEWKALSSDAGLPIFHECGVLFFFADRGALFPRQRRGARGSSVWRPRCWTQAEMARRFPMIDFDGISVGLYEPQFGALMARRSVQTLVERFVRDGGAYVEGAVQPPRRARRCPKSCCRAASASPRTASCSPLGPWLPKLFPDVIGDRIVPTRQEIFFFAPPAGDGRFAPGAMPCWADFNHGDMFYGFPDLEGRGVKFAHDVHGPVVDPDTQDRRPTDAALADVVAFRDRRFPLLARRSAHRSARLPVREQLERRFPDRFPPGPRQCAAGRRRLGPRLQARPAKSAAMRPIALFGSVQAGAALQPRLEERDPTAATSISPASSPLRRARAEAAGPSSCSRPAFPRRSCRAPPDRSGFRSSPDGGAGRAARRST